MDRVEDNPRPRGDPGKLLDDAAHTGQDAQLIRRAIRNRWPIPERLKAQVIATMGEIVTMSDDNRDRIAASKVIAQAEGQNQVDELAEEKNARLDAGKATENVVAHVFNVPPPRELGKSE